MVHNRRKDFYSTALTVCLDRNWVERAKKCIKEGADINFIEVPDEGEEVDTAPIFAAARGCTDELFVNYLVDALEPAGDDKNRATVYGRALNEFFIKKYRYAARVLMEKGADTNFYSEWPNADQTLPSNINGVVIGASASDDEQLMQRVVDKLPVAGENKTLARMYGNALSNILCRGWLDSAKILIEKGADVNFYGSYESDGAIKVYGVVLNASVGNDKEVMQTIVDRLNPTGENTLGARLYGEALYHVILKQWFDIAVQLVEKGASLDKLNEYMREHLERYQASLEKENAIKEDALKLEEVFGEEQSLPVEPSAIVHSEKIPALMEKSSKATP